MADEVTTIANLNAKAEVATRAAANKESYALYRDHERRLKSLLSREPASLNELLDVFLDYLSTIETPLRTAAEVIRDQFNYRQGDIFLHTTGTIDRAYMMSKWVEKLRDRCNRDDTVTISIPRHQVRGLIRANEQVIAYAGNAVSVFEMIEQFNREDEDAIGFNIHDIVSLCSRGLASVTDSEGTQLMQFNSILRASISPEAHEGTA